MKIGPNPLLTKQQPIKNYNQRVNGLHFMAENATNGMMDADAQNAR
jgi:hypothetical protein